MMWDLEFPTHHLGLSLQLKSNPYAKTITCHSLSRNMLNNLPMIWYSAD